MTTIAMGVGALSEPGSDRGLGRYASHLINSAKNLRGYDVKLIESASTHNETRWLGAQFKLVSNTRGTDLFHATGPDQLPLIKSTPWVCSVLDTIPLDIEQPTGRGLKTRWVHSRLKRCDAIVALSEYTSSRVTDLFQIDPSRIVVAPLPVELSFSSAQRSQAGAAPYISTLVDDRTPDPRKRNHWVEQVAAALFHNRIEVRVAGRGINKSNYPSCTVVGELNDTQLATFFANSQAFFYPSAYEGQGLPPLEAMASGTPVVAFKNSAIEQMVGVEEFLIKDPAPWSTSNLSNQLERNFLDVVVQRIIDVVDESRNEALRRKAAARAAMLSTDVVPTALKHAYAIALSRPAGMRDMAEHD